MADPKKELPADLVEFRDSYVEMFGTLPPLPAARFQFSGEVNPEFLRIAEQLRAHAFYNDVFDMKTTQLILFGMLLIEHNADRGAGACRCRPPGRRKLAGTAQGGRACGRHRRALSVQPGQRAAQRAAREGAGGVDRRLNE